MKQKLFILVAVIATTVFLSGCIATHVGTMSGSASLDSPNFIYKKQNIYGESQATYVLGIGGEARQALVLEAKKSMMRENPLLRNQAFANVTVSYKTTSFVGFIVTIVKCTVSADIVEFGPVQTDFSQSQSMNQTSTTSINNTSAGINERNNNVTISNSIPIKVGDKVKIVNYFNKPVDGKVTEIKNGDFTVEYTSSNNKTKKVKVLEFQIQRCSSPDQQHEI